MELLEFNRLTVNEEIARTILTGLSEQCYIKGYAIKMTIFSQKLIKWTDIGVPNRI
jgi:hypothetical protein